VVNFKEGGEVMLDVLWGEGVRWSIPMVFGTKTDKLVFTRWFQHSIGAPNISLPVRWRNTVKTAAVKNHDECVIRVGKL